MTVHRKRARHAAPADTLGRRLKWWRIHRGMSQEALADAVSRAGWPLTKSFISLLERDRTDASVRSLRAIAAALGLNIHYLVTGQGEPFAEGAAPEAWERPEWRAALEAVCAFIEEWDPHVAGTPWRLSDVVRLKFGLIRKADMRPSPTAPSAVRELLRPEGEPPPAPKRSHP